MKSPIHSARRTRGLALMLTCALVASLAGPSVAQEQEVELLDRVERTVGHLGVVRYAGQTRTDTARLIGTDMAAAGFEGSTVLLARADAFPDSLAGSYLAGVRRAPVLLTYRDEVSPDVLSALAELAPDSVVLLGGEGVIGSGVEEQLAQSFAVERLAGADRFATAAVIARQVGTPSAASDGLALVASGEAFPDALAAGPIAAAEQVPLLLTARDLLPDATAEALVDLDIDEVVLAGGAAAVSPGVAAAIEALGIDVTRVAGVNRQQTARRLAEFARDRFGWAPSRVTLVSGAGFPDAVAMAPHAGLRATGPSPIVLTGGDTLGVETTAWLADIASCAITGIDIGGGQAAVPEAVEDAAVAALTPEGGCADEIDDQPPAVAFTTPDEGAVVTMDAEGIELAGTAEDAGSGVARVEIRVDVLGDEVVGTAVHDGRGTFEWAVDVTPDQPGTYAFTATAVDAAGNQASAQRTVEVVYPDADAILVFDDVRVLDAQGRACVREVSADEVLLSCSLDEAGLALGDVVASLPTPAAPEGLMRRLVSCASEGAAVRCGAPTAPLTEAFAQADATLQVPVTSEGAVGVSAHPSVTMELLAPPPEVPRTIDPDIRRPPIIDSIDSHAERFGSTASGYDRRLVDKRWQASFDVDLAEEAGLPGSFALDGELEVSLYVDVDLDIDIDWCWRGICGASFTHFKVELGGAESLAVDYEADLGGELDIDPVELGSILLARKVFTIGPVPVVVSGTLDFDLGVDGFLNGGIEGRAEQSVAVALGFQYVSGDGWSPIARLDEEFEFDRVDDSGPVNAEVRPFVGVQLNLRVYGVRGPFVRGEPYVLIDLLVGRDPLFYLSIGFKATAGIFVKVLGYELVDYDTTLVDVSSVVATSDNYPQESPPSVTIVGPDGFPLVFDPGGAGIFPPDPPPVPGQPRQYACCDVLLDYSADFSGVDEAPEELEVRWTAEPMGGGTPIDLGPAGEGVARLSLSPGIYYVTGQFATRDGGNLKGVPDVVRVEVSDDPQISVDPVTGDAAGALELAQAAATDPSLVTGARFETLPAELTDVHAVASGVPGQDRAALLTTGSAALANSRRTPGTDGPGEEGEPDGVRGDSDAHVTVLAIDVDVPEAASCLRFGFRYASEELPDYVGSRFNDAFVAELDATTWTVAGSQLQAPDNFARTTSGLPVMTNSLFTADVDEINAAYTTYDQATRLLRAATPVTPGAHTLYLSILDQGDETYESAVFIDGLEAVNASPSACVSGAL